MRSLNSMRRVYRSVFYKDKVEVVVILGKNSIWTLCVGLFMIIGMYSLYNREYGYLSYSLLTIGFILSNVLLKDSKPQKITLIIQALLIISLLILKVLKFDDSILSIVLCVVISISYGNILVRKISAKGK